MPLTHEEIGEFIGSSRETVTRTFSDFKSRHLVALKGSTVTIPNRAALESVAGAKERAMKSFSRSMIGVLERSGEVAGDSVQRTGR